MGKLAFYQGMKPFFVSPYIQYSNTPLIKKFKPKNYKYRFASYLDEYISLYYTFLESSGNELPWNNKNVELLLDQIYDYDEKILKKYNNRSMETIYNIEKLNNFELPYGNVDYEKL